MPRRFARVALVAALFALPGLVASQAPAPCVNFPADGVLRAAGRYCLTADRAVSRTIGIEIVAPNVVVDLGGKTLSNSRRGPTTTGIMVREAGRNALVTRGAIDGFTTGLAQSSGEGLRVEAVTFRRIGAMAISSSGHRAQFRGNVIESVGGQPLDPKNAYSIAANLSGRDVVFQSNTIRGVNRQGMPQQVVGEAVGILVGSECEDCVIAENTVGKVTVEAESIGIWNSGNGKVTIRNNVVTGFDQGIITLGRKFVVHDNEVACSTGATSTGLLMSLGRTGDVNGEGGGFANRYRNCAIEQLICDNGCKAPWVLETINRLRQARPRP